MKNCIGPMHKLQDLLSCRCHAEKCKVEFIFQLYKCHRIMFLNINNEAFQLFGQSVVLWMSKKVTLSCSLNTTQQNVLLCGDMIIENALLSKNDSR